MQTIDASSAGSNWQRKTVEGRPSRKALWIAGGLALGALTALALAQSWVTISGLLPLLFFLPCVGMMFFCMKGMNHSQNAQDSNTVKSAPPSSPPTSIEN